MGGVTKKNGEILPTQERDSATENYSSCLETTVVYIYILLLLLFLLIIIIHLNLKEKKTNNNYYIKYIIYMININ